MKVILVTTSFPPLIGGIETYAYNLAQGLNEEGLQLKVLTSVGVRGNINSSNMLVVRTPSWLNIRYIKIIPLLLTAIFMCLIDKPDYIIAMTWRHEGVVAYLLRKLLKIKYIIVSHGTEITAVCDKYVHRSLMLRIFGSTQSIVANSNFTKKTLANTLNIDQHCIVVINPPLNIPYLPNNIDISDIDRKFKLTGKRTILTVSRMVKRKNHALVIRIMAELKELYPDLVYVMTGTGEYQQQLRNLAHDLGVVTHVRFAGFVSADDLQGLYQRSEIYISPSIDEQGDIEGFGISLIEANAYGKPVIVGNSGGVGDAVINGVTGFLVDPDNSTEVRDTLIRLLDNEELRYKVGQAGRQRVFENFSIKRQAEKFCDVLVSGEGLSNVRNG